MLNFFQPLLQDYELHSNRYENILSTNFSKVSNNGQSSVLLYEIMAFV